MKKTTRKIKNIFVDVFSDEGFVMNERNDVSGFKETEGGFHLSMKKGNETKSKVRYLLVTVQEDQK